MAKKLDDIELQNLTTDDVILRIYKHILDSKVMNGGWDKVEIQLDNMESRLALISEKVDKIDLKINDPDDGLIVKYKELNYWKTQHDNIEQTAKEKFDKKKWLVIGFIVSSFGSIALVILQHYLKI
jgi:hypothetical protein